MCPEIPAKASWYDVAFLTFDVVCSIYSVVMGYYFFYASKSNSCKLGIPLFLVIYGFGNFLLCTTRFFHPPSGSVLQLLFNLGMIVYGSLLVVGNALAVDMNDPSSPYYCHYGTFRIALGITVTLICYFGAFLSLLCCCFVIYKGRRSSGARHTWAYKYSSGYLYCSMYFMTRIVTLLKEMRRKKSSLANQTVEGTAE